MQHKRVMVAVWLAVSPVSGQDSYVEPVRLSDQAPGRWNEGPAWSPDGTRIAFLSRGDDISDLYLVNADGSDLTPLTNDDDWDGLPVWSPDGTVIAFTSRQGTIDSQIHLIRPDGTERLHLTATLGNDGAGHESPAWSPDGSQIAFALDHSSSLSHIWVVDVSTGTVSQVTEGPYYDKQPFWSPDGRIGFQSNRDGTQEEIYVIGESGEPENLTRHPASDRFWFHSSAGRNPWSPDGAWIAFSSDRDSDIHSGDIYLLPMVGGGAVRRLTASRLTEFAATWSPDSRHIAYESEGSSRTDDIYVVSIDTGEARRVTKEPTEDRQPVWSPDGRWIAYAAMGQEGMHVMVVPSNQTVETVGSAGEVRTINGDVIIRGQRQLAAFLDTVGSQFKVFGDLLISRTELEDMSPLSGLQEVDGGSLVIQGNPSLTSLRGLEHLRHLDGLTISSNNTLQSLQGLDSLREVTFTVSISGNPELESLHGLDQLQVAGDLILNGNAALTSMQGLESLQTVGGWPTFANGHLTISRNSSLTNLTGLNSLRQVDGELQISDNTELRRLEGLAALEHVQISIEISRNPLLGDLDALTSLTSFPGHPVVGSFPGVLIVSRNPSLRSIAGLRGLRDMRTGVSITANDSLESLAGLEGWLFGSVTVEGCHALVDLSGLLGRTRVSDLLLRDNASLQSLAGLDSLREARGITISRNPALASLAGLDRLRSVQEHVSIFDNAALTSLEGLDSLRSAGSTVIRDNPLVPAEEVAALEARLRELGDVGTDPDEDSGELIDGMPERSALQPPYPNPFNGSTTVTYDVAAIDSERPVRVEIFSMSGQLVRTLVDARPSAARWTVEWDGHMADGTVAGAGVYVVRLTVGSRRMTQKVLLLR